MGMTWFIISWLYLAGMGAIYAIDDSSSRLFWFTAVLLVFWPLWVTFISLWFLWLTIKERKWIST
jgi:hypothetical protein